MSPRRRTTLQWLATGAAGAAGLAAPGRGIAATHSRTDEDLITPGRRLIFPRDFGAHPGARTEWWYITGWLKAAGAAAGSGPASPGHTPELGFQITFFRSRTGLAADNPSRFAVRQLIFAHAALTDLRATGGRLRHDQRVAREGFGIASAATEDTQLRLRDWTLKRSSSPAAHSVYALRAASESAGFTLELDLASTQAVLLQGDAGFSRKGPELAQASHYYSQPQLQASGRVRVDSRWLEVQGRGWMDHEWSETLMAPEAVGWDWIGMNLFDGRALTAFQLRRADGSALWSGGSLATADRAWSRYGEVAASQGMSFKPGELQFTPGRIWVSPLSRARYPVEWIIDTPAGRFAVRTRLDAQELDSRNSTGAVYWEGLSDLLDASGRPVGLGYLEMTGYASPLII